MPAADTTGMSVDLADFAPSLRREITPLGTSVFSAVSDDILTAYLSDAFWEARLDGFLLGFTADEDGIVTPTTDNGSSFPRAEVALVVLYAGIKVLRNKILNMNTKFKAVAGPVEFEQQNSAVMLVEMLKELTNTKARLQHLIQDQTLVSIFDAFSTRTYSDLSYYGGIQLTGF